MIRESLSLLHHIRDDFRQTGIIIGVSGKDSLVVLDLCHQVFGSDNVVGFHLEILPHLECVESTLGMVERRYGIAIHRLAHPDASDYLRFSRFRKCSPTVEDKIQRNLRWADIEAVMRSRTGLEWIAQGHRITDSLQRRAMIQRHRGLMKKQRRIYPIWDWKPVDVFAYIRQKRIPVPPMFGSRIDKTSGVAPGSAECMLYLKNHHPRDYQRIVSVFPGVETLAYRDELRASYETKQA